MNISWTWEGNSRDLKKKSLPLRTDIQADRRTKWSIRGAMPRKIDWLIPHKREKKILERGSYLFFFVFIIHI